MHYSTRAIGAQGKADYFRRHTTVENQIKAQVKPTVENITSALGFPVGLITSGHLTLCAEIISNPLKFVLPRVNTEHVAPFSAVAGPDNTKGNGTPGCYLLADSSYMDQPLSPGSKSFCYIGQSIRLGKRVKEHAKGLEVATSSFLSSLGDSATAYLFIVTDEIQTQLNGLSMKEFLCVLEQYMFMHFYPSVNRSLVATAGVLHSPEALENLRKANGNEVHIYERTSEDEKAPLTWRYTAPSRGLVSTQLLGYERLRVRRIIRRGGWFRDKLFFSTTLLQGAVIDLITFEQLKQLVDQLKTIPTYGTPPVAVTILDVETGLTHPFTTKSDAVKFLKCDREVVKRGRANLYKRRYKITVL